MTCLGVSGTCNLTYGFQEIYLTKIDGYINNPKICNILGVHKSPLQAYIAESDSPGGTNIRRSQKMVQLLFRGRETPGHP